MNEHYPIAGAQVTDVCTVTMDETGKSFCGQEYVSRGDKPLAFYSVSGHLVDPSYDSRTLRPGYYAALLCREIDDLCKNADRVVFVRNPDEFAVSAAGPRDPLHWDNCQGSYSLATLEKMLRSDMKKDLLVFEFSMFLGKPDELAHTEQLVLKKIKALFSTLGYRRILILSPLPTGCRVLDDVCRSGQMSKSQ